MSTNKTIQEDINKMYGPRTIDKTYGPGTQQRYQAVLSKYSLSSVVWLVTFRDGDGWEQTIYVITPDKGHAVSSARALSTFDKPRLSTTYKHSLKDLEPAEIAEFVNALGKVQNIAIFEPEPEE